MKVYAKNVLRYSKSSLERNKNITRELQKLSMIFFEASKDKRKMRLNHSKKTHLHGYFKVFKDTVKPP